MIFSDIVCKFQDIYTILKTDNQRFNLEHKFFKYNAVPVTLLYGQIGMSHLFISLITWGVIFFKHNSNILTNCLKPKSILFLSLTRLNNTLFVCRIAKII